jgi:hypothetical protein
LTSLHKVVFSTSLMGTKMDCLDLRPHLESLYTCRQTEDGLRVLTTCVYPSFDQVPVFVVPLGSSFIVHDGGGAFQSAWDHGRNDHLIRKLLDREAVRFRLKIDGDVLVADVKSAEWLPSAIMSVANASALAANAIVDHVVASTEADLAEKIFIALRLVYNEPRIKREYSIEGRSGKSHKFDFAIGEPDKKIILLDAVSPHHSSIAHKYMAFSDVKTALNGSAFGIAVFDRVLDSSDKSLIQQVADLVPIVAVSETSLRVLQ